MNCIVLLVLLVGVVAANALPVEIDGELLLHRSRRDMTYPGDCESSKLRKFASKCGLTVTAGGSHYIVRHGADMVTTIPHSMKTNNTCRSIIKELNAMCPKGVTVSPPVTTTKKPTTKKPKKG